MRDVVSEAVVGAKRLDGKKAINKLPTFGII